MLDIILVFIELAKGLSKYPIYLSIIIVVYCDGLFIEHYFFAQENQDVSLFSILALTYGVIYLISITTLLLICSIKYLPFSDIEKTKSVLFSCSLMSSGSLGAFFLTWLLECLFQTFLMGLDNKTKFIIDICFKALALLFSIVIFFLAAKKLRTTFMKIIRDQGDENAFR